MDSIPVEVPWILISFDIINLFYYIFIYFNQFLYSVLGYFSPIVDEVLSFLCVSSNPNEFCSFLMNFYNFKAFV